MSTCFVCLEDTLSLFNPNHSCECKFDVHKNCWHQYESATTTPKCPICRQSTIQQNNSVRRRGRRPVVVPPRRHTTTNDNSKITAIVGFILMISLIIVAALVYSQPPPPPPPPPTWFDTLYDMFVLINFLNRWTG